MKIANDWRTDWLGWRRDGVGASDVAPICGISGYADASPWTVWADKAGLLPEREQNEAMEAGHWMEKAIAPWFTARTGLCVVGEQTWCTHPVYDHHRCTVDGFVVESPDSDIAEALGLLEIKHEAFGKAWDQVPDHFVAQVQWQMHVCGMPRAWIAVLQGRSLRIHEVERDQADIDFMVGKVDKFWNDHVLRGVPPEPDGSEATGRVLAELYQGGEPDAIEVPAVLVADWVQARAAVKAADGVLSEAENALKAFMGDHEAASVNGALAATWKPQSRAGVLDIERMTVDGLDVEKYRKPSTTFRVLRAAGKAKP